MGPEPEFFELDPPHAVECGLCGTARELGVLVKYGPSFYGEEERAGWDDWTEPPWTPVDSGWVCPACANERSR